ncbi:MAG: MAPEG family protein [Oscillatoriales cyanobacterium SM2_1_8]|nr:MAPEG family protein [Oscillatoriales cyanobacterium SM2_1_8]
MFGFSPEKILLGSIAAAAILIYLPLPLAAYGRIQAAGMEGVASPRDSATLEKMPGFAKRALWAHQNALEAFGLYAAAALMVFATGKPSAYTSTVAAVFLAARVVHAIAYIGNVAPLRGLAFAVGIGCIASLMGTGIKGLAL